MLGMSFAIAGFRDSLDDKSKANLVQIKGRFSVTSENLDLAKVLFFRSDVFKLWPILTNEWNLGYSIRCSSTSIFTGTLSLLTFWFDVKRKFLPWHQLFLCLLQGSPLRKSASVGDWMFESKQMVCLSLVCVSLGIISRCTSFFLARNYYRRIVSYQSFP